MLVEAVRVGVDPDPELEVEESVEPAIIADDQECTFRGIARRMELIEATVEHEEWAGEMFELRRGNHRD